MLNYDWLLNVIDGNKVNSTENVQEEKAGEEQNDSDRIQKELKNQINQSLIDKSRFIPNMIYTNLNVKISNTSSTMCNLM
jgi:hypothetical protein